MVFLLDVTHSPAQRTLGAHFKGGPLHPALGGRLGW